MKLHMKEYTNYNESEILDLYESVGWSNYTSQSEMDLPLYMSKIY